jgi:hypothetical protein
MMELRFRIGARGLLSPGPVSLLLPLLLGLTP